MLDEVKKLILDVESDEYRRMNVWLGRDKIVEEKKKIQNWD